MSVVDAHPAQIQASDIAGRFVAARLHRRALAAYPGPLPMDMAQAYATQDAAINLYPDQIVGWKVGMVPPALHASLDARRLAGPIFSGNLWGASGDPTPVPAISGGFTAVEAEFVARIGVVDPSQMDWTLDQAAAAVEALHIGVEIAGSPLPTINDLGSAVVASDFGNNAGLILGPPIQDWQGHLEAIQVETVVDGVSIGRGTAGSIPAGILESVRFLIEHCARRGRPVAAGTLISTGAVTGVHRVEAGAEAVCAFSGVGEIHCRVVTAKA